MSKSLSRIERGLVLQYLSEEKPVLQIQTSTQFSLSAEIKKNEYEIIGEKIYIAISVLPSWAAAVKTPVLISFYYKQRGLSFLTALVVDVQDFCLIIPPEINKPSPASLDADTVQSTYSAWLSFSNDKKATPYSCVSLSDYPLFTPDTWKSFDFSNNPEFFTLLKQTAGFTICTLPPMVTPDFFSSGKMLVFFSDQIPVSDPFPFDACMIESEVRQKLSTRFEQFVSSVSQLPYAAYIPLGNSGRTIIGLSSQAIQKIKDTQQLVNVIDRMVSFLPMCLYLSKKHPVKSAIENRREPIKLLYLSPSSVIFACGLQDFPFQAQQEYLLTLFIGLRKIKAYCRVARVFTHEKNLAAFCIFTSIKQEDLRLIHEKHYRSLYE